MASAVTFELFKLLVEEVREARRARRELANAFMTLNLGGVAALGFLAKGGGGLNPALLFWCAIALMLTCVIWRMANSYYIYLLRTKFDIVYEYETQLGFDALQREWRKLPRNGPFKWFSLERAMPVLFIVGYAVFLAYQVSWPDMVVMAKQASAPLSQLIESRHH
ncbi:MAG: hypothetical protein ABUL73_02715 [Alphaproteobacteria bacterium]